MSFNKVLLDSLDQLSLLTKEAGLETDRTDTLKTLIENYRVLLPIVGSFNTGKSSMLNSLLDMNILPVGVTAKTLVPYEITYGENVATVIRNDYEQRVGLRDIGLPSFDMKGVSLVKLSMQNEHLGKYSNVTVVDMPGIDAAMNDDEGEVLSYLKKSVAYVLAFCADEPVIKESIASFLSELRLREIPVYVILTKSDKITPAELSQAKDFFRDNIPSQLGVDDIPIATVSSRPKPSVDAFKDIISSVSGRADRLCFDTYTGDVQEICENLTSYFSLRKSTLGLTSSQVGKRSARISEHAERLKQAFTEAGESFVTRMGQLGRIVEEILYSHLISAAEAIEVMLFSRSKDESCVDRVAYDVISAVVKGDVKTVLSWYTREAEEITRRFSSGEMSDVFSDFSLAIPTELCDPRYIYQEILSFMRPTKTEIQNFTDSIERKTTALERKELITAQLLPVLCKDIANCFESGIKFVASHITEEMQLIVDARLEMLEAALKGLESDEQQDEQSRQDMVDELEKKLLTLETISKELTEAGYAF